MFHGPIINLANIAFEVNGIVRSAQLRSAKRGFAQ